MKALIPIAIGQTIDPKVISGLLMQSIPMSIIICGTVGIVNSQRNLSKTKYNAEARSRQLCSDNAKKIKDKDKYILMIDSDTVLTDVNAVSELKCKLDKNNKLGAVAISFENAPKITLSPPHVNIKCMMFRRALFAEIPWQKSIVEGCLCKKVKHFMNTKGYEVEYLDYYKSRGYEIL